MRGQSGRHSEHLSRKQKTKKEYESRSIDMSKDSHSDMIIPTLNYPRMVWPWGNNFKFPF